MTYSLKNTKAKPTKSIKTSGTLRNKWSCILVDVSIYRQHKAESQVKITFGNLCKTSIWAFQC